MASQAIKDIKDALVDQINTEVPAFGLVTDDVRHSEEYGSGNYPVCIVRAGGRKHDPFVSKSDWIDIELFIRIICKNSQDEGDLTDLYESAIDAINTDIQLNDTCIKAMTLNADPPIVWPRDEKFIMDAMIIVTYERVIA